MARLGMDVDLVETASKELKRRAGDIDGLIADLDKTVGGLQGVWEGPDAKAFITQWWPEHRKQLIAVSSHIEGLGQSAWNNAQDQRNASRG
jgi:uncharacterized protein YukE